MSLSPWNPPHLPGHDAGSGPMPGPADGRLERERRHRRRRQYRVRSLMMAVLVSGFWFGFLRLPGAWVMVAAPLVYLGLALAIMLAAMALGWFGFGLFAAWDWVVARSRRAGPRPGPVDEWWA